MDTIKQYVSAPKETVYTSEGSSIIKIASVSTQETKYLFTMVYLQVQIKNPLHVVHIYWFLGIIFVIYSQKLLLSFMKQQN